jgi:hypothetical protein
VRLPAAAAHSDAHPGLPGGAHRAVKRPPLAVTLVAMLVVALGEISGALMSRFRNPIQDYAKSRVQANALAHGLAGSAEYDQEVTARAVYTAEAGLSFFHTHAQGVGPLVLFASTLAATLVPWRRVRGIVYLLFAVGGFFPVGYLAYSVAVLERGRDAGVELAEWLVLAPLGSLVVMGLLTLAAALLAGKRPPASPSPSFPGDARGPSG